MTPVDRLVRAWIERRGPVPLHEVVDAALYHPEGGFYTGDGRAGRRGDFVTSPEVGPLFGAVLARALDTWWDAAGRPDPYVVVEAGAGPGTLATAVLAASPRCGAALRYVLVEVSAAQRARHRERLPVVDPAAALPDLVAGAESPPRGAGAGGPVVVSLPELPRVQAPCTVIANELLDNLPFGVAELDPDGWMEVRVGSQGDRLVEVRSPLHPGVAERLPDAPVGARAPLQHHAARWVDDARDLAGPGGRLVAIDYTSTTSELARRPWTEWVRTYRQHARGGHLLDALGTQDITCEVAIDQLPEPTRITDQAGWLAAHGIEDLVEEGRRVWRERAAIGDLAALRARSRITEAEALLDPSGLGGFQVLEWVAEG